MGFSGWLCSCCCGDSAGGIIRTEVVGRIWRWVGLGIDEWFGGRADR